MKKMFKRALSLMLTVLILVGAVPMTMVPAQAANIDLIWPCESAYKVTTLYYYKSKSNEWCTLEPGNCAHHSCKYGYTRGMDIAGGGNIVAVEEGKVITATDLGAKKSFGKYVEIEHADGSISLYGHMSSYCVKKGQIVKKGQKIGVMGSTGNSTGTHLHFEFSAADPWKTFYWNKYASKISYQQNVRSNNVTNAEENNKEIVQIIDNYYTKSGEYYYYKGGISSGIIDCSCKTSYAGTYSTQNVSTKLNIRWGHSKDYGLKGSIPAGATFKVTKADGKWAHVSYNGVDGYVSMDYIKKVGSNNSIIDSFKNPLDKGPGLLDNLFYENNNISNKTTSENKSGYVHRTMSEAGKNMLKQSEGLRLDAYDDATSKTIGAGEGNTVKGTLTIGYGHIGSDVKPGLVITKAQAEQLFNNDIKKYEDAVDLYFKTYNTYATQNQFDALVHFTFNVGTGWTTPGSDYPETHKFFQTNNHTYKEVEDRFFSWLKPPSLKGRRIKEINLYCYGNYNGVGGSTTAVKGESSSNNSAISVSGYTAGNYVVTTKAGLNIRTGPGTNYGKAGGISYNQTVAVTEVNKNWGKISGGWICLDYTRWVSSLEPVIPVPGAPRLTVTGKANIPVGDSVTVTWPSASDAVCYDIYLKNSSGAVVEKITGSTGNSAAFKIKTAGTYTITAVSRNTKHTSSSSNVINVSAHNPSTVTFVDWNNAVLSKQSVPYGSSATAPANPSRYGWTFKKWVGIYSNVTSNQTITAQYERNIYTVTFVDEKGEVIGNKQKVQFEGAATAPSYTAPEGYTFLEWDKKFNYVESNLTVKPVIVWSNEQLPITILSTTTAVRESTGYTVNVSIRNYPTKAIDGRIIVALKTDSGKLLSMTESAAFHLKASADKTIEVFMPYDKAATKAEVYVVEKFSTAIPISAVMSMTINQGTAWTNWSTTPNPSEAYQAESRKEYRYRTKSTTTSTNSSLSGWTKYDTTSAWGAYGAWSGWTDSYIAPSDSRQVETRQVVASTNYKTVYHYYRYASSEHASSGSYAQSASYPNKYSYTFDSPLGTATALNGHTRYKWWYNGTNWHGLYADSPYTTDEVVSYNYKTQYRYRDRTLNYTYYYYKWSDWSAWSTTAASATSTKEVQTRTTYRYIANDPSLVADNSGVERTISGYVDKSLADEQATLFIYKVDEASDFTNEYVGQTIIGVDGSYSFKFKLREEPTIKTGDYTVTLGIEGTSTAIYLDPIEAPKPQYTVTYKDWDGTVISTQTVEEGQNAVMPETDPTREGYDFICWNETGTNVKDDLIISPVYRIKTYSVVFVDWMKESLVLHTYEHGQPLTPPEIEEVDDSYIVGWDAIINGTTTVTDNMVVTAQYEKKTFNVTFLDETGETIDEQVVEFGLSAEAPALLSNENVNLLGWSTDGETESVVKNLVVVPVYSFKETVAKPYSTVITGEYTEKQTVTLECETEDAVIYYTLDGEDPSINGTEYTGPFEITESAELQFVACAFEMNNSEITRELIAINDGSKPAKHIIEFIGNDAETEFDTFFIEDGAKLGFTADNFARTGYDFNGIYYGEEFDILWDLNKDIVTESMTMFLWWTPKTYTVTFIGFDDEVLDVQQVPYLEEVEVPQCDDVNGYVFAGFDSSDYVIKGDTTYTARYIPEDEYVEVSLNKSKYNILSGTSFTLEATLSNINSSVDSTVLWCSSDENVVKVSDDGTVTGVGAGIALIYAIYEESGSIDVCAVTVEANIDEAITPNSNSGIGFDSENQVRGISAKNNQLSVVKTFFVNSGLTFKNMNGAELTDTDLVGTGTIIKLINAEEVVDEKIVVVTGDMTGDGKVNNRDASKTVRYLVGKETADLAQLTAIDVNGDGYVNNRDASMISRYLVGKEDF